MAVATVGAITGPAAKATPFHDLRHESWSVASGAPSRVNAITQSTDGFLWIGGVEGLFRFDGVTFEPVQFSAAPSDRLIVSQMAATRDGAVWVGLARGRGVAVYRDGRLEDAAMPNPSREVTDIREDAEGGVWIARGGRGDNTLARHWRGAWREYGAAAGLPEQPVWSLLITRTGTLWVALSDTIVIRRPGAERFEATGIAVSPRAGLAEDPDGAVWVADSTGTRRIDGGLDGAAPPRHAAIPHPDRVGGVRIVFDRGGDLWETTWNSGALRLRQPRARLGDSRGMGEGGGERPPEPETYGASSGLTSDQTRALFEDREGGLWIGTELGLDRLSRADVVAETGIPANSPTSYRLAAALDGAIHVADADGLYTARPGAEPRRVLRLDTPAEALCARRDGGVWLFVADRVLAVDDKGAQARPKPPGAVAYGCAEDRDGRLWMPALDRGLFVLDGPGWRVWPGTAKGEDGALGGALPANAILDGDGRAVILFRGAPLPPDAATPFRSVSASHPGLGGIEGLFATPTGVLASGVKGLARVLDAAAPILSADRHPWAGSMNGLAQAGAGPTWTIGDFGIARLDTPDLAVALTHPETPIPARIFTFQDGLDSFAQKAPGAQVAIGGDGRVWFLTRRHVMRVDPAALVTNPLVPPVVIRSISAHGREIGVAARVETPPGTTSLKIAYTALSLAAPRRVQFRYRLVGRDDAWTDPGGSREVVFTDLGPGAYRFDVRASNNDGVWNEIGASVAITIPAHFHETPWFKILCGLALILALRVVYLLRVRQVARGIRERLEERTRERERIARDLHDTLLQSVQGLIMRFQSVANRLPESEAAHGVLTSALDRAEQVLVEGRDRLRGLRRMDERQLERELSRLVSEQPFVPPTRVSVTSQGARRAIEPEIFDEILCIAGEAIFNAARHARASEVEVRVDYAPRRLEVRVRDDGVGVPPDILADGGREGHFGLLGMRERARRIRATLTIESPSGRGTTVTLRIGAEIAYARRAA